VRGSDLHDAAEIHYGDAAADVLDYRQIVRDEQISEAEFLLQVLEQIDDLRLDRHVERRDGFVAHDQLRLDRERARDPDALALAAGEFVRIAAHVVRLEADRFEQRTTTRSLNAALDGARLWIVSASPMIAPTVMRGLSEANGS